MDIKAIKFIVSGRVQGVGFRWFVLNEAQKLGIIGTVKNNIDGTVEVFAQSSLTDIFKLKAALEKGPGMSRIDKIMQIDQNTNDYLNEFKVIY